MEHADYARAFSLFHGGTDMHKLGETQYKLQERKKKQKIVDLACLVACRCGIPAIDGF